MATNDYGSHSMNGLIATTSMASSIPPASTTLSTLFSASPTLSHRPSFSHRCFCNIPLDPIFSSWITSNLRNLLRSPGDSKRAISTVVQLLASSPTSDTKPAEPSPWTSSTYAISAFLASAVPYLSSIPCLGLGERDLACICSSTHGLLLFRNPISKYYIINPFIKQEYRGIFLQIPPSTTSTSRSCNPTTSPMPTIYIVCPVQPLRCVLLAYTSVGLPFNPRRGSQHQD